MKPPKYTKRECNSCGTQLETYSGEYLRWLRLQSGLSLRKLADKVGWSHSYLYEIERETRWPTQDIVAAYEKLVAT